MELANKNLREFLNQREFQKLNRMDIKVLLVHRSHNVREWRVNINKYYYDIETKFENKVIE